MMLPKPKRYQNKKFLAYVRKKPCVLAGRHECIPPISSCHIKTKGSGGGDEQVFPGCIKAHAEQEGKTRRFEEKYGVNLREIAERYWAQFQNKGRSHGQDGESNTGGRDHVIDPADEDPGRFPF